MRTFKFILLCFFIAFACKKKEITTHDVVQISCDTQLAADGTTLLKVVASIPSKAIDGKQEITFKAKIGNFKDGTNGSIKIKADNDKIVEGKLSAIVYFIAPMDPGQVTLSASIEEYTDSISVQLNKVSPDSISISSDVFAVKVNFGGNVILGADLISAAGGMVSKGHKVKFVDTDLSNNPLNGTFLTNSISSNDKSQVSTKYTPGLLTPNTYIFLKAIYLNDQGNETSIRDSVKVYLLP